MYPAISEIKEYAADDNAKWPFIMCEYAHAMGNSSGNFQRVLGYNLQCQSHAGRLYLGLG